MARARTGGGDAHRQGAHQPVAGAQADLHHLGTRHAPSPPPPHLSNSNAAGCGHEPSTRTHTHTHTHPHTLRTVHAAGVRGGVLGRLVRVIDHQRWCVGLHSVRCRVRRTTSSSSQPRPASPRATSSPPWPSAMVRALLSAAQQRSPLAVAAHRRRLQPFPHPAVRRRAVDGRSPRPLLRRSCRRVCLRDGPPPFSEQRRVLDTSTPRKPRTVTCSHRPRTHHPYLPTATPTWAPREPQPATRFQAGL